MVTSEVLSLSAIESDAHRYREILKYFQRLLSGIGDEGVGGSIAVMLAVVVHETLEMFGLIGCGFTGLALEDVAL